MSFTCFGGIVFSQSMEKVNFRAWEDSLIRVRGQVINATGESERALLNEQFMSLLEQVLRLPQSFAFSWDSVRNFTVIAAPDNRLRLFTWALPKPDQSMECYGFIQYHVPEQLVRYPPNIKGKQRAKFIEKHRNFIFPLYDKRAHIDNPTTFIGDHNFWYGAIYYAIVPFELNATTYYALLGWNSNDFFTNQKLIEILHFKNDKPVFGAKVFKDWPPKTEERRPLADYDSPNKSTPRVSRILLNYNKLSTLTLRYDKQIYKVKSEKKDPKTHRAVEEPVENDMIVFNQLIPMDNKMPEIPAFMVPETSLNQGFIYQNYKWVYIPNVEARDKTDKRVIVPHPVKHRDFYLSK
ncbi:MAG: hypothetical protein LBR51_00875 [Bacteroidales bacterium]|nr:hypothetical protein [Bacteroidales bacterium]